MISIKPQKFFKMSLGNQKKNEQMKIYHLCLQLIQIIYLYIMQLRIHWRLLTISKTNGKMYVVMLFENRIFWKDFQYTIKKTEMLKKFRSDKINSTRNTLFFLSRDPTHHSFTFNLRYLYELKHKSGLSVFFAQQNAWTLWLLNFIISFKIKIIEKPHTVLFPGLWFLSCNKKF